MSYREPTDRSLWYVLVGFLVFCVVVGLLFGRIAYGVVQTVLGAMS
ncbi:hypothetical protein [Cryptosporangium minutisporangium]|uniref:Uncharacterized protein n=1 Tax=Cryptosporangium minutisporangium TaxID=113569 RepID=A0ABP6SZU7_9ACTN